jgi:hypothetical protein
MNDVMGSRWRMPRFGKRKMKVAIVQNSTCVSSASIGGSSAAREHASLHALCVIASFVPQTRPKSSKNVMMPPDGNPNSEQSLLAWSGAAFSMDGILRISCSSSYPQAWAGRTGESVIP